MPFVRSVLGDIDPSELGITDAHEHIIIAGGRPVEMSADMRLDDADKAVLELTQARSMGLRTVVDAMPCGLGRDAEMLAEVSRRSGVNVIAPTGIHTSVWYDDRHWSHTVGAAAMAELFGADVTEGIDRLDYSGPIVERTDIRAGVIKVGGSADFPTERDATVFQAAAMAQQATGVPILTHTDGGQRGLEQARFLADHGADLSHVLLSHVDKVVDHEYHRELAATGARVEFDQGFRWGDGPNGTLRILEWLVEDGLTDHVTLGLDAARQGYWQVYGGSPGISWFVDGLSALLSERGIGQHVQQRFYIDNPAAAYTFIE
jgi:predicted metal-dependent phosphotriesterase family hydrolase